LSLPCWPVPVASPPLIYLGSDRACLAGSRGSVIAASARNRSTDRFLYLQGLGAFEPVHTGSPIMSGKGTMVLLTVFMAMASATARVTPSSENG
jgi:hypothetical protein